MILAALALALAAPPQEPAAQPAPELHGYELRFRGNEAVTAAELEKAAADELADLERHGFRRAEVDDAAFVMESYYRALGFPDARVRWRTRVEGDKLIAVFRIEEGPRCALGRVRVRGARALTREQVRAFFVPPGSDLLDGGPYYVASVVAAAPAGIRAAYWGLGYLDAEVEPVATTFASDRSSVELLVKVREGVAYKIRRIELAGNEQLAAAELEEILARFRGAPFFPRRAYELRTAVVEAYGNAGFPDTTVEVEEERNPATGAVRLTLHVVEGPKVTIAGVDIRGNERTTAAFIRSRLRLRKGDPWTLRAEHASFKQLFATGLFRRIRLGLEGDGPERILAVQVEEAKAKEVTVEPGYGSYEGARLELGFRERNVFGTGRQFRTELEASQVGWSALAGLTDPWLFGSGVEADLPVFVRRRREPSFTREEVGAALDLRKEFGRFFALSGGLGLRQSNVSALRVRPGSKLLAENVQILALDLEPSWDSRNDLFNPTRGGLARLQLERGLDVWKGDLEFLRARLTLARVQPLNERETTLLAGGLRTGVVVPTGSTKEIPLQERLFNGGENTVRGFEEGELGPLDRFGDPLGGETATSLNLELRQKLGGNLWSGAFVDAGNVGKDTSAWLDDFRTGAGLGLRYLLPVGALRLDAAWNLGPRPGENAFLLYLSVGMAF
ncbi:MAG: hypothetical protein D6702_12415 [Planctomycetota bacterium]|nr:MAG: hypothetical protein D6702_12415 [Planctomycetota bacterium]